MIEILKQTIRMKSGLVNQLLVFAAVFIVLLGELIGAMNLATTYNTMPGLMMLLIRLMLFGLGSLVLYYGMGQVNQTDEATGSSLMPFLLNSVILLGACHLMVETSVRLLVFDLGLVWLLAGVLYGISLLAIGIGALCLWLVATNEPGGSQVDRYMLRALRLYFQNNDLLTFSLLTVFITSIFIIFLELIFWPAIIQLDHTPLLILFYKTASNACILSASILWLTKGTMIILGDESHYEAQGNSPFGFIIAGLFLVVIIAVNMPNRPQLVEDEYNEIVAQAEVYRAEGQLYLTGNAYKKAYAMTKAYKAYLMEREVVKDNEATDEQKNRVRNEANTLFREAYDFYPNGAMIYYLDGLRTMEENPGAAMNAFTSAKTYDPSLYQADLMKLKLAKEMNQEDLIDEMVQELLVSGIHTGESNMNTFGLRRIERALEAVEAYEETALENITTIAYDYYNNQLYPEAMAELQVIVQILPKDMVTNYLIAMTDLELKADNKTYTTAIEAAETILNEYPGEAWAQDLYAGVTLRAGNQAVMDEALKEAYRRAPNDMDVAEQYAYSLLKKNYSASYFEVTEEAEAVVDQVLAQDQDRWFANYCKGLICVYKGDYEVAIKHFNHFQAQIIEDPSLFSIYDELYNTYVMKYARRMTMDPLAVEVLNTSEMVDGFTYNYTMAAFGTMSHEVDIMATIDYLDKAIAFNPRFSKPYYMLGNAYMEYGYHKSQPEFYGEAVSYYDRSIQIFEEDPYAWFAIGHAYRKQERYEEAMGAFQKTLTYMPAEDHQTDHFGVSIHSHYQIAELERLIAEKEGN